MTQLSQLVTFLVLTVLIAAVGYFFYRKTRSLTDKLEELERRFSSPSPVESQESTECCEIDDALGLFDIDGSSAKTD